MELPKEKFVEMIAGNTGILNKICFAFYNFDDEDKNDLRQEILLQLWKSFPDYRKEARFSTWMYKVALNTAITFKKKHKIKFSHDIEISEVPDVSADNCADSERKELLYRALNQLNKIEKAIILLWLEEKTYKEISDIMGISEKNVSVKLVRIKNKISKLIGGEDES